MASGWTNFAVNVILEKTLRGVAGTFPSNFYVGLYTSTPSDTGGGTELTTGTLGSYARQTIATATGSWAALSLGSTSNAAIINFGTAGTGSVTVSQWGLFDASTVGNLWFWSDLSPAQVVAVGNPYSFAIGAFVIGCI